MSGSPLSISRVGAGAQAFPTRSSPVSARPAHQESGRHVPSHLICRLPHGHVVLASVSMHDVPGKREHFDSVVDQNFLIRLQLRIEEAKHDFIKGRFRSDERRRSDRNWRTPTGLAGLSSPLSNSMANVLSPFHRGAISISCLPPNLLDILAPCSDRLIAAALPFLRLAFASLIMPRTSFDGLGFCIGPFLRMLQVSHSRRRITMPVNFKLHHYRED